MSRRPAKPRLSPTAACPCGLPGTYAACCGRLHQGQAEATSAEQLMRSRFSAFAAHDEAYLLRSWHPDTRPAAVEFDDGLVWQRLEVLGSTEGGPFHSEGTVEFRAHYLDGRETGAMQENSRFLRYEGAWVYLDSLSLD
ncbi:YchJ family protein [Kitasatospora sp. McL0602]|uniref:YchJ family protein n=1 Tax=Kitasatospora sp. McL0602 TaxID=3439530 RepID=UPI003F8CA2C5